MRYETVSTSIEIRTKLLRALLNVPHDLYELSAIVNEPTFVVGGELRELQRDRLVALTYTQHARVWHITGKGLELATRADQQRFLCPGHRALSGLEVAPVGALCLLCGGVEER